MYVLLVVPPAPQPASEFAVGCSEGRHKISPCLPPRGDRRGCDGNVTRNRAARHPIDTESRVRQPAVGPAPVASGAASDSPRIDSASAFIDVRWFIAVRWI